MRGEEQALSEHGTWVLSLAPAQQKNGKKIPNTEPAESDRRKRTSSIRKQFLIPTCAKLQAGLTPVSLYVTLTMYPNEDYLKQKR